MRTRGVTTTAVIGAGPAGLLFCAVSRILWGQRGGSPEDWRLVLFDKRESYERTHRLRIEPKPYLELQRELVDPRYDELIAFLSEAGWRPAVNLLEERLEALARSLGVEKELLCVGPGDEEASLEDVRARLEVGGQLEPGAPLVIVAADSVRSATRALAGGDAYRVGRSHQGVARLWVEGPGLPAALGTVEQFKLSKLLGSILDYRLNANGYAEVDLFLSPGELAALAPLGATPKAPRALSPSEVAALGAPLFQRTVHYLRERLGTEPLAVSLQSTFELEQSHTSRMSFDLGPLAGRVFLVGDAGISLPFFRGMACLGSCVGSLARIQVALAGGELSLPQAAARYEEEVAGIRAREQALVRSRAALVRVAKEFVRVSSLVPFPIQNWLLSVPSEPEQPGERSAAFWLNLAFALTALGAALTGPLVSLGTGVSAWSALSLLAIPIQVAGGVLYHYTSDHLPRSLPLVRRVWRAQVTALAALGISLTVYTSWRAGRPTWISASLAWWFLGLFFVAGLYLFEALAARWVAGAQDPPEATVD